MGPPGPYRVVPAAKQGDGVRTQSQPLHQGLAYLPLHEVPEDTSRNNSRQFLGDYSAKGTLPH